VLGLVLAEMSEIFFETQCVPYEIYSIGDNVLWSFAVDYTRRLPFERWLRLYFVIAYLLVPSVNSRRGYLRSYRQNGRNFTNDGS